MWHKLIGQRGWTQQSLIKLQQNRLIEIDNLMIIFCIIGVAFARFLGQINEISGGYLTVYLLPHSHDDVGWVKTADDYYTMQRGVRQIINSYMESLLKDETKKFSQVEIAFFSRWWAEQNQTMKDNVKELVRKGQLEFLNGGWCMNDEATSYYEDIIDQMTLGHQFILEHFNYTPTIGWQVDPFGHSSAQAQLFNMMGFQAWFIGRIDEDDKAIRSKKKELEMVMRPPNAANLEYPILTHVNYYGYYSSPRGFDFDVSQHTQQVTTQNLPSKSLEFAKYFKTQSESYQGNILVHTLGMDFEWSDAERFFSNIDKLMANVNAQKDELHMRIIYGTPKDYIGAIHKQNLTYPVKTDDFFPYADAQNSFWTGYFTSRVAFKGFIKRTGRYAQIMRRFISAALISGKVPFVAQTSPAEQHSKLSQELGTCQHHDAVTGTAKQYVTDDYIAKLSAAYDNMEAYMSEAIASAVEQEIEEVNVNYRQCNLNLTAIECSTYSPLEKGQVVLLTLIDAKINRKDEEIIRVKVPKLGNLTIRDQQNEKVSGEIVCANKNNTSDCDLYFIHKSEGSDLLSYYKIFQAESDPSTSMVIGQAYPASNTAAYSLRGYKSFHLNYAAYSSYGGGGPQSGAYLFRPQREQTEPSAYGAVISATSYEGQIISMIYVQREFTETWIRAFPTQKDVYYIETFINSIPETSQQGNEVVIQINTNIKNNKVFYTDSSGLDLIKRQIDHRDSWDLVVTEPVAGNYYPVNGIIMIQDPKTKEAAAVLNDRPEGGTSLSQGKIELMIHRRLFRDDNKGVMENLNEQEYNSDQGRNIGLRQYVSHTLALYNIAEQPNRHRELQFRQDYTPLQYYAVSATKSFKSHKSILSTFVETLTQEKLVKVYLYPLFKESKYILRLQNMNENKVIKYEIPVNNEETTLTGNQKLAQWKSTQYNWMTPERSDKKQGHSQEANSLAPLQIRTFLVNL